jgi:hypothetical protein
LTGFVEVFGNTTAGGAVTGDAVNENEFAAEVVVDNTGLGLLGVTNPIAPALINDGLPIVDAAITLTGPESYNAVTAITNTRLDICNNNSLVVTNLSTQDALTGDATVSHNTFGGSAISGDAINRSATGVSLTVAN